jgi:NAD(P)-dependent dehydrogenase (short-subunit alcohol dehydrogenase family)
LPRPAPTSIDILVNNAGGPLFNAPFLDVRDEGWRRLMALNLDSVVEFCRLVGRHMTARGSGSIVNITSISTFRPWPAIAGYGAAKAAVLNLTQTLAQEWGRDGVRINAISPGWIRTRINQAFVDSEEASQATGESVPIGRWGEPADVAAAALWLASDAAAYVTGAHIPVDGGLSVAVPEDWRELRINRGWMEPK